MYMDEEEDTYVNNRSRSNSEVKVTRARSSSDPKVVTEKKGHQRSRSNSGLHKLRNKISLGTRRSCEKSERLPTGRVRSSTTPVGMGMTTTLSDNHKPKKPKAPRTVTHDLEDFGYAIPYPRSLNQRRRSLSQNDIFFEIDENIFYQNSSGEEIEDLSEEEEAFSPPEVTLPRPALRRRSLSQNDLGNIEALTKKSPKSSLKKKLLLNFKRQRSRNDCRDNFEEEAIKIEKQTTAYDRERIATSLDNLDVVGRERDGIETANKKLKKSVSIESQTKDESTDGEAPIEMIPIQIHCDSCYAKLRHTGEQPYACNTGEKPYTGCNKENMQPQKPAEEITLTIGQAFDLAYKKFMETSTKDIDVKKQFLLLQKKVQQLTQENLDLKARVADLERLVDPQQLEDFDRNRENAHKTSTSSKPTEVPVVGRRLENLVMDDPNKTYATPHTNGVTSPTAKSPVMPLLAPPPPVPPRQNMAHVQPAAAQSAAQPALIQPALQPTHHAHAAVDVFGGASSAPQSSSHAAFPTSAHQGGAVDPFGMPSFNPSGGDIDTQLLSVNRELLDLQTGFSQGLFMGTEDFNLDSLDPLKN